VPSIPTVTNNICDFKSLSQTNIYNECSTPEPNYDILIDLFESSYTGAAAGRVKAAVSPSLVKLVPAYGVTLTQRQLDEAISESGGAPTKLDRYDVSKAVLVDAVNDLATCLQQGCLSQPCSNLVTTL
uniref:Uncharacterized protein n=1 Tax=Amphimedon queenslandica TaxID=400682 RepID=A0A1X7VIY7_AMPQE